MERTDRSGKTPPPAEPKGGSGGIRTLTTQDLFAGASEVRIRHHEVEYRLKVTRQGKLILTK